MFPGSVVATESWLQIKSCVLVMRLMFPGQFGVNMVMIFCAGILIVACMWWPFAARMSIFAGFVVSHKMLTCKKMPTSSIRRTDTDAWNLYTFRRQLDKPLRISASSVQAWNGVWEMNLWCAKTLVRAGVAHVQSLTRVTTSIGRVVSLVSIKRTLFFRREKTSAALGTRHQVQMRFWFPSMHLVILFVSFGILWCDSSANIIGTIFTGNQKCRCHPMFLFAETIRHLCLSNTPMKLFPSCDWIRGCLIVIMLFKLITLGRPTWKQNIAIKFCILRTSQKIWCKNTSLTLSDSSLPLGIHNATFQYHGMFANSCWRYITWITNGWIILIEPNEACIDDVQQVTHAFFGKHTLAKSNFDVSLPNHYQSMQKKLQPSLAKIKHPWTS